jgi:hypothetical protein
MKHSHRHRGLNASINDIVKRIPGYSVHPKGSKVTHAIIFGVSTPVFLNNHFGIFTEDYKASAETSDISFAFTRMSWHCSLMPAEYFHGVHKSNAKFMYNLAQAAQRDYDKTFVKSTTWLEKYAKTQQTAVCWSG